jgi:hypothetical protein
MQDAPLGGAPDRRANPMGRSRTIRHSQADHRQSERSFIRTAARVANTNSPAAVDQARSVQTCDCIDSPEMFAALAFELRNRPRPLRIGSQQQTEDSFLCRSSSSAGIRLISSCMGRSFLSLPRPGQLELRRGTFRLGFRQADRQDAISKIYMLVSIH